MHLLCNVLFFYKEKVVLLYFLDIRLMAHTEVFSRSIDLQYPQVSSKSTLQYTCSTPQCSTELHYAQVPSKSTYIYSYDTPHCLAKL
jgi:hypothetical protein